jgi:hypothetical protein
MKYIILSVNENVDYFAYVPLTCWAWRRIGWEPILFYHRENESDSLTLVEELVAKYSSVETHFLKSIPGYRSDTITQVSRLYGQCLNGNKQYRADDYIMLGDIDLIPLSDYWHPDNNRIIVYGHDLTNYTHYPMCYIGMNREKWNDVMGTTWPGDYNAFIQRDLDKIPNAKEQDFYKRWFVDQDLITERLLPYKDKITFVDRGKYANGYAFGRVDRGEWNVNQHNWIDSHLHRDLFKHFYTKELPQDQRDLYAKKWQDHMDLLNKVWPEDELNWFVEFTMQYAKLVQ